MKMIAELKLWKITEVDGDRLRVGSHVRPRRLPWLFRLLTFLAFELDRLGEAVAGESLRK